LEYPSLHIYNVYSYHVVQEFNKGVYDYIIATDESNGNGEEDEESEDVDEGEDEDEEEAEEEEEEEDEQANIEEEGEENCEYLASIFPLCFHSFF
jgi:ATP-dependent RNA helicase DDX56/DBP9